MGTWSGTQWTAAALGYSVRLGAFWFELLGTPIYHPWLLFEWWYFFDTYAHDAFLAGGAIAASSGLVAARRQSACRCGELANRGSLTHMDLPAGPVRRKSAKQDRRRRLATSWDKPGSANSFQDKIAASKKGMWMGGPVPLGIESRIANSSRFPKRPSEYKIYQRYLDLSGVRELGSVLRRDGIRSKARNERPAAHFSRGALYALLSNPLYVGRVQHKDVCNPGQHEGSSILRFGRRLRRN